jgi:hypothetical protein
MQPTDAIAWLAARGANPWLVRHHELVLEAAEEITRALGAELMLAFDRDHVLLGAAIHDAGKVEHPAEMHAAGHEHERAGERALLDAGFDARIARICVTHAAWDEPRAGLEDRLVALADKLWKGKRDEALERALVDEIARATEREPWEVFERFDAICERVAARGPERLARSQV